MTTFILTITKTNFAAQVCHDQCPVRCRGPPQEPTQKRELLHTIGEFGDDDDEDDHFVLCFETLSFDLSHVVVVDDDLVIVVE